MGSKDFSRPQGPRLRIALSKYERGTRNFKPVKNAAALVNVHDAAEQRRLWAAIENVIADEEWRNERTAGPDAVPADAAPAV